MYTANPFQFTEKQAAFYARIDTKQLRNLPIPYLQYADNLPRYYRKKDLDQLINQHIRNACCS